MTPRQLFALKKRKIGEMQWWELMFSRLTAAVCNFGFARPKEPVDQLAFMMHPLRNGHTVKPEPPPPNEPPGTTLIRLLEGLPPGIVKHV